MFGERVLVAQDKNPSDRFVHQFNRAVFPITGTEAKVRCLGNLLDDSKNGSISHKKDIEAEEIHREKSRIEMFCGRGEWCGDKSPYRYFKCV